MLLASNVGHPTVSGLKNLFNLTILRRVQNKKTAISTKKASISKVLIR